MVNSNYLQHFSGKRVFITGHTGFKGSWLSYILYLIGAEVKGFSLPPFFPQSHFDLLNLDSKFNSVFGDIRDYNLLSKELTSFKPEYVIHLAAQPLVLRSYKDPKETFDINIGGGTNVLEAVRHCESIRSLVFITSDKCYENNEWIWGYRESDAMGGIDPYSASKGAIELVFSSYQRSFFVKQLSLGCATARAGNVIGGGDWSPNRILPDTVKSLFANKPIVIRSPQATRPWQHVLEPLSGYLQLADALYTKPVDNAGSWNFGPPVGNQYTVVDLVSTLINLYGSGQLEVEQSSYSPHEASLLQLNSDKARQLLDWSTRWDFEKTLTYTLEWYKSVFVSGMSAEDITRSQINAYFGISL